MHQLFSRLNSWWDRHKPLPVNKMMAVEYDDTTVRVKVLKRLEPEWNQTFRWIDVVHTCFRDGGISEPDMLLIYVHKRDQPVVVMMEAEGAAELLRALKSLGLFKQETLLNAMCRGA